MESTPNSTHSNGKEAESTDQAAAQIPSLDELAQLTDIAYDQVRKSVAESMGIRVSILDLEVHKRRSSVAVEPDNPIPSPSLWSGLIVLSDLLDEINEAVLRHVVLNKAQAIAITLFVIMTYCVDAITCCPILGIQSPEKRCGKTTLIDLLMRLVFRPIAGANISPAVMFRVIESYRPTLAIDEADTFLDTNPDMIGMINSGHTRATAYVWRVEDRGNGFEPQKFSTWTPKIIAQIGSLPETVSDRSITINLRRKHADESVKRLRKCDYSDLQRQAYTWALDNMGRLQDVDPDIPENLNDREADSWEPLLAIAELAGGNWPNNARAAATKLSGSDSDTDSIRIQLLADLRTIFKEDTRRGWCTSDLLHQLCKFEDHPWPTYSKGNSINARQLAGLLKPFGIKPDVQHKLDYKRGYMTDAFDDVFQRYLSPESSDMPLDSHEINDIGEKSSVRSDRRLADEKTLKPLVHNESNGITHELPSATDRHMHTDVTPKINEGDDSWTF